MLSSVLHLVAISVDRYIAILHPLHYKLILNKKSLTIMLFFVEILSVFVATMPFYWTDPHWDGSICDVTIFPYEYSLYIITIPIALSALTMVILYARVFFVAWQQSKKIHLQTANCNKYQLKDIKAAKTLSLTVGCYLICWTPLLVYFGIMKCSDGLLHDKYNIGELLLLLAVSNSGLNFIIYAVMNAGFRSAFKKMRRCGTKQYTH